MNQPSNNEQPRNESSPKSADELYEASGEVRSKLLTILLGAEGMSELRDKTWLRDATQEERQSFLQTKALTEEEYREIVVDGTGRPYWLVTLLEHAPDEAKRKAAAYIRVLRLLD